MSLSDRLAAQRNQELREKAGGEAKQGAFTRVLDILMRPSYASAGVAKALVKGENVWDEFWKGIKGQDKETYSDVFDAMGWKPTTKTGKIARGVVGFGADVLLDPTTYLGSGLTKAGKAIQAGKILASTGKVATAAEKTAIATRNLLSAGKRGTPLLKDLAPTLGKQAAAGERALLTFGGKTLIKGEAALKGISKLGSLMEKSEYIQKLGILAEGGGLGVKWIKPAGMTDDVFANFKKGLKAEAIANKVRAGEGLEAAKQLFKKEKKWLKEGIKKSDIDNVIAKLADNTVEILPKLQSTYDDFAKIRNLSNETLEAARIPLLKGFDITHMPTDKYFTMFPPKSSVLSLGTKREIPKQFHRGWFKKTNGDVVNMVERTVYRDGKLIDKLSKQGVVDLTKAGLKIADPMEINKAVGMDIYSTSLGVIAGTMINKIGKIEGGMEFASNIKQFGKMAHEAPKEWKASSLKLLKDAHGNPLMFEPGVAKHLDEIYTRYASTELSGDFIRNFKKVQNTWKGLVTYVNIPFHARNAVSNVWQNHLAGISPLSKAYWTSGSIKTKLKLGKELSEKEAQHMAEFIGQGLKGVGWFGADIEKQLGKKTNIFFGFGQAIGETIEDHARLAHFIAKREKGLSAQAAADSVQKYLFDYSELSDFERLTLKPIMPFYTWSRKNLPLQVETLITQPGKIAQLGKIKAEIEAQTDKKFKPPEMMLPQWMKERLPVYMGGNAKVSKFSMLGGYLPSADLGEAMNPLKKALSLVTPFAKVPLELEANYSFFFKNEITEYEGQREEFFRMKIPASWKFVLTQIRPLNEINKVFKDRYNPLQKNYEMKIGQGLKEYLTSFKIYDLDVKYMKQNFAGKGWSPATVYQKIQSDHRKAKKSGDKKEAKRLQQLLDKHDAMSEVQLGIER